jgi:hypothetical protein
LRFRSSITITETWHAYAKDDHENRCGVRTGELHISPLCLRIFFDLGMKINLSVVQEKRITIETPCYENKNFPIDFQQFSPRSEKIEEENYDPYSSKFQARQECWKPSKNFFDLSLFRVLKRNSLILIRLLKQGL